MIKLYNNIKILQIMEIKLDKIYYKKHLINLINNKYKIN